MVITLKKGTIYNINNIQRKDGIANDVIMILRKNTHDRRDLFIIFVGCSYLSPELHLMSFRGIIMRLTWKCSV